MGSLKLHKTRTLLSRSTHVQNRRRKSKALAALVLALVGVLGSVGDLVGVMAFPIARVGAGAMDPTSGPPITLKAASWLTLSTQKLNISYAVFCLKKKKMEK